MPTSSESHSDTQFDLSVVDNTPTPLFANPRYRRPSPEAASVVSALPAGAGSDVALSQLYAEYSQRLFNYSMSLLHSREDAEDAVQTTFMNAFNSMQSGTSPRLEAPWLFRIARNVCLNRIRTHQRKPAGTLDGIDIASGRMTDDAASEHLHILALRAALQTLPQTQRTAFVMRELQGASYSEIAEALQTTHGAIESLIFRARRQLAMTMRRSLAGEGVLQAA